MRRSRVAAWVTVVVGIMLFPQTILRASQSPGERQRSHDTFLERVDGYVRLHRELERVLPPEIVTPELDALFAPRIALRREMRKARASARQGEIFTPGVAVYFRVLIAETLKWKGIADLLVTLEDENTVHIPAAVNGDYPAGRSMPMMPPDLLGALPPLPPELRYSFIGTNLILWDPHAGLIVDFVPNALPLLTGPECGW